MRVRSVVLPAVLAVAAAVLAPTSAQAAQMCNLLMPTKVVVDARTVETPVALTTGCFTPDRADHAYWDLEHGGTVLYSLDFESEDLDEGPSAAWTIPWEDVDPMGRWTTRGYEAPTVGGGFLTQNTAVTMVKYASKLTTKVTRTGGKLSWAVTATQWSGRKHTNVPRPKASVGLFHQKPGSTTWTYVTSVTTSSTGKATVSLAVPKAGSYRLKVAETPSVWASYSPIVQGRR